MLFSRLCGIKERLPILHTRNIPLNFSEHFPNLPHDDRISLTESIEKLHIYRVVEKCSWLKIVLIVWVLLVCMRDRIRKSESNVGQIDFEKIEFKIDSQLVHFLVFVIVLDQRAKKPTSNSNRHIGTHIWTLSRTQGWGRG